MSGNQRQSGDNTVSSSSEPIDLSSTSKDVPKESAGSNNIWIPLESDPDIMTEYLRLLTLTDHYLIDVPVIDEAEEMGIFAGHNLKAFIFLYETNQRTESETSEAVKSPPGPDAKLFHIKQLIQNSCGSVALFHAYINTVEVARFEPTSIMNKYYLDTVEGDFERKGQVFADNEDICGMHHTSARYGQSEVPSGQQLNDVNYHFVAIIWRDGGVYKMDGRCDNPVLLDSCPKDGFSKAGLEAIKKMIMRDPDNLNFSILGFCGN